MSLADNFNKTGKPKTVVTMQVTDEDTLDAGRMNVGSEDLSTGAFPAVYQVCRLP